MHHIDKKWEPLGNTIIGTKSSSFSGSLITLSGDGNRLFVNDNESHTIRAYQWEGGAADTTTSWTDIGQISGNNVEAIDLTASMSGDRIAIGFKGSVSVCEYQFDDIVNT